MGGATSWAVRKDSPTGISIHAPRGGSDSPRFQLLAAKMDFNPRSPWGERPLMSASWFRFCVFQSTLPVGGATLPFTEYLRQREISIHAPRGGSDSQATMPKYARFHFNPRSPWGERPHNIGDTAHITRFQSTLPVGGATKLGRLKGQPNEISIHAPRGGSD